jgi:hypothetical protein
MIRFLKTHDGQSIAVDSDLLPQIQLHRWRVYSHDDWQTAEAATDVHREGVRTTMMLSRYVMGLELGRELLDTERVRRKKQKLGTAWDFRRKNLELQTQEENGE